MTHHHNTVSVHLARFVDRDVFARNKAFIPEMKSDVVGPGAGLIMECPASAGLMHEVTAAILLIGPHPRNPAGFAMRSPEFRIDPAVQIERRDDRVGDSSVAFGMIGLACELNTNLPELWGNDVLRIGFDCSVGIRVFLVFLAWRLLGLEHPNTHRRIIRPEFHANPILAELRAWLLICVNSAARAVFCFAAGQFDCRPGA
jgi:hypothetical protein